MDLYNYLKSNNLTDLDRDSFFKKYSNPQEGQKIYNYLKSKGNTDLDFNSFNNKYLSNSTPQQQPVTPPVTQQTNESEKNAFAQQIEITPTKIENFKKNKVDNHITEFVFFILFLFIALYFFHKRK
jgi:hypothetical protein